MFGMVEAPGGLRLAEEAPLVRLGLGIGESPSADGLDRDDAIDQRIARLVDDTHRALRDLAEDLVAAEHGAGGDEDVVHVRRHARIVPASRGGDAVE